MCYSMIAILAFSVHLIINSGLLWHKSDYSSTPAFGEYRTFIIGILAFCATDTLWGLLDEFHFIPLLYPVTVLYFIGIMAAFLLWTRYVIAYMKADALLSKSLFWTGILLFGAELVILIINFFVPIQFSFDGNGVYHAGSARYVTLGLQAVLFLLTTVYTLVTKAETKESTMRIRRLVGMFCATMATLVIVQQFYPSLPLYSIGFLLDSCMLHSFVLEDEKREYRKTLEKMLRRDREQQQELGTAKRQIYTDPLTGAGSKLAYMEDCEALQRRIHSGEAKEFAVVVFDLNNLKEINDNEGHDAGDVCIYNACLLINKFFGSSPVYRIGGDEFVAVLTGGDYQNRDSLLASFDRQAEENLDTGGVVVSSGMSAYTAGSDKNYLNVFERADRQMYRRKRRLKEMRKTHQAAL